MSETFTVKSVIGDLVPSLRAARAINATCGSYIDQLQKLIAQDFAAFTAIASAGLDIPTAKAEAKVYTVGMAALSDDFTKYIRSLNNGGRDPDAVTAT